MSSEASFRFSIATTPQFDGDIFTVRDELQLVKVALLYADSARLYSPGTSMVTQLRKHRDASTDEERHAYVVNYLTKRVLTDPGGEVGRRFPDLQMYLRGERDPTKREAVVRSAVQRRTKPPSDHDDEWENLGVEAWEFGRQAGADEVLRAVDAGLIELHEFREDAEMGWADASPERGAEKALEFVEAVSGVMADRKTHPVFTANAAAVAREAVSRGLVTPSQAQVNRGRHAGLAADVLRRLPTFESASVDEVLAVRDELAGPLVGFRGAMSRFASEIAAEPWSEDFGVEAEDVFVREVEPRVQEIRDAVEANSSLANLARKAGNPKAIAGGLTVLLAGLPILPAVAAVALGAGVASSWTFYEAHKEWTAEQPKNSQNQMYFYHRAEEVLTRRA